MGGRELETEPIQPPSLGNPVFKASSTIPFSKKRLRLYPGTPEFMEDTRGLIQMPNTSADSSELRSEAASRKGAQHPVISAWDICASRVEDGDHREQKKYRLPVPIETSSSHPVAVEPWLPALGGYRNTPPNPVEDEIEQTDHSFAMANVRFCGGRQDVWDLFSGTTTLSRPRDHSIGARGLFVSVSRTGRQDYGPAGNPTAGGPAVLSPLSPSVPEELRSRPAPIAEGDVTQRTNTWPRRILIQGPWVVSDVRLALGGPEAVGHAVMNVPHWRYHTPNEAVRLRFMIRGFGQSNVNPIIHLILGSQEYRMASDNSS